MDLSFLIANILAFAAKNVWFKKDTRARDVVLPILVVATNFLAQLSKALGAEGVSTDLIGDTATASAISLGVHQGALWGKSILGGK